MFLFTTNGRGHAVELFKNVELFSQVKSAILVTELKHIACINS